MLPLEINLVTFLHGFAGLSGALDWLLVFSASYLPYVCVIGALFAVARQDSWKRRVLAFLFLASAIILSRGIIAAGIHQFFERARPFEALSLEPLLSVSPHASFPSGHASFLFALAFALLAGRWRSAWGWWVLGGATVNAVARIVAGVHWPSDVLGGALVALLSVVLLQLLFREPLRALFPDHAPPEREHPEPRENILPVDSRSAE